MKRTKFIVFAVATLFIVSLFSNCSKQKATDSTQQSKHEATLIEIQKIRANVAEYKNTHKGLKTTATSGAAAIKAVGADVSGCAMGFRVGIKVGAALGNPVTGSAAGAVLGAVIGSGWSLWCSWNNDVAPPPGSPGPSWANGYTNIYQRVGYIHDVSCVSLFSTSPNYPRNPNDFCTAVTPVISNYICNAYGIDPSVVSQCISMSDLQYFLSNYNPNGTVSDNMPLIAQYVPDQNILNYTQEFLTDLLSCDPSDTTDMYAFCNAYTSYINSDTTLTQPESTYLLYSINVAQYSTALWFSNLANFG